MDGPWARQYEEDENGEPLLDEEGNPIVDQDKLNRYQYNGKELTSDLGLNWNDYGARWYDPAIARFPSIDRFSENYYSLTPYQYAGNSPIVNIDVNGDSIRTYFYDRDGNQLNTVPAVVQQMFQSEYGISVDYNATTGMLYKVGDVDSGINTVSGPGKAIVDNALGTDNPATELVFGYNLGYVTNKGKPVGVGFGEHVGQEGAGIALIDLADFNDNGSIRYHKPNEKFHNRSLNLGRTFEHEFFGHGVEGYAGHPEGERDAVDYVNKNFRAPAGIPTRKGYSDNFSNFGSLEYRPKKALTRPKRMINIARY